MVTGNRFGMKAAIADGRIFLPAFGAHRKSRHSRLPPVVRQIADNGKARPAKGTVDKRILQAVRLRLPVAQTFRTDGNIGSYLRHFVRIRTTGSNTKIRIGVFCHHYFRNRDTMDGSHDRMFAPDAPDKLFTLQGCQGGTDADPVVPVVHLSANSHLTGYAINKRAEAYSLY